MRLLKSIYVITKYGNLFADELPEWLIQAGFIQYQCYMSIYYIYAPYGTKIVVLSYVDDCVYWYYYEAIVKWSLDTLGERLYVNFLGYAHWFMSTRISQMNDHYISVDQAIYATYMVEKHLDTTTVKARTTLPYDMIFTKAYASTSDEKSEKLTR